MSESELKMTEGEYNDIVYYRRLKESMERMKESMERIAEEKQ
jgi:hypothetical protein